MATFVLEDLNASIEVFVFPKAMADYGALLDDDAIVVVKGRVDIRDDRLKVVCMEVQRPELATDGLERPADLAAPRQPHRPDGGRAQAAPRGAPGRLAGLPPRRREGAPPALRIQRGQPAGAWWASSGCSSGPMPSKAEGGDRCGGGDPRHPGPPLVAGLWASHGTRIRQRRANPVKSVDGA